MGDERTLRDFYVGIDPGKLGGIAVLERETRIATTFSLSKKTERDISEFVMPYGRKRQRTLFLIERVHSSPQQGVVSAYTFGRGYGFLRGLLAAMEAPYDEVTPATWQRKLKCLTGGDKNVTKAKAQQLFPGIKVTHNVADALLIAYYALQHHEGET